jgi:GTPase SAR1 family protein
MDTKDELNQGQRKAAEGFFSWLFDPSSKELNISGPGGVGKTFLMGKLIDEILPRYFDTCKLMGIPPEYDSVVMTATTNQAAEVLGLSTGRPTETVHSFFNLTVKDDFKTGESILTKTRNWVVHERKIIFVDEASMVDSKLRKYILEGTHNCKLVYVGDHCQLAPVKETLSPVYRNGLPIFVLTEPMRNSKQPALMALCQQLRDTVETGVFNPIQVVPGVIDWLDNHQIQAELANTFLRQTLDARILAYTNPQVVGFNDYIRDLRQLPDEYSVGEMLISNSAVQLSMTSRLSIQEEVEIVEQAPLTIMEKIAAGGVELEVRETKLRTRLGSVVSVKLPVNREHFAQLVKYFQQAKNWERYFHLKNTYPDLRQRDAATVHKAQGSTVETVYIDVGNLSTCHQPNTAARLLYVAATRARSRIVMYGELAQKYGGIIY